MYRLTYYVHGKKHVLWFKRFGALIEQLSDCIDAGWNCGVAFIPEQMAKPAEDL